MSSQPFSFPSAVFPLASVEKSVTTTFIRCENSFVAEAVARHLTEAATEFAVGWLNANPSDRVAAHLEAASALLANAAELVKG